MLDVYVNGVIVGSIHCGFKGPIALIPKLSSDNGQCIASYNVSRAYRAFDGSPSTNDVDESTKDNTLSRLWWNNNSSTSGYIGYDFVTPKTVKIIEWKASYSINCNHCKTIQLQASDDGSNWVNIDSQIASEQNYTVQKRSINNDSAYRYWRIYLSNGTYGVGLDNLQFYGF